MNLQYDSQIRAWIGAHKEEILEDLCSLCRIPSVRGEAEENAPYGKECARALKAAAALFEKHGFSVRVEEARGYALARLEKGEKTIPVKSFTVAGNFYEMLRNIDAMGSNLEFPHMGNVGSPSVLVQGLSIAGK